MNNKRIFKGFNALVLGSTLVLSMGGCGNVNVLLEKESVLSVTPSKVFSEYLKQYVSDSVSIQPSVVELKGLVDDYALLSDVKSDSDTKTKGINLDMINYDFKDDSGLSTLYYFNDNLIKKVSAYSVYYCVDGYDVEIFNSGKINISFGDRVVSFLSDDDSYSISCSNKDKSYGYSFNLDGYLVESNFNNNYYSYKDGNPDFYSIYKDDVLIYETLDDGFIKYDYNSCVDKKYLTDSAFSAFGDISFDKVSYKYNSDSSLVNIRGIDDNRSCLVFGDMRCNYYDQNDSFSKYYYFNSDNSYRVVTDYVDDSMSLSVNSFDSSGDLISIYNDNVLTFEVRDGIRYFYDDTGVLEHSEQVVDDGVIYYNSNGVKESLKDFKGYTKIRYNTDGTVNIVYEDGKTTTYYDYDNNLIKSLDFDGVVTEYYMNQNVKRVYNYGNAEFIYGDNNIVENGEVTFYESGRLESIRNGDVYKSYYESGNIHEDYVVDDGVCYYESGNKMSITKNGVTTGFDELGNIISISKDGVSTRYYDYNSNLVESVISNGIRFEYFEDQGVNSVTNFDGDSYQYGGYILNKGDFIQYYNDGVVRMESFDGCRVDYNHDGSISSISESGKTIGYYDYSINNISYTIEDNVRINYFRDGNISSINNNGDEVFPCDLYGVHYDLKQGESVSFHENHSLSRIVQDGLAMSYYDNGVFSGVENYREKPYIFTYANQRFNVNQGDNIYFYGDGVVRSKKQDNCNFSYFSDGSLRTTDDGVRRVVYYNSNDLNLYSIRENGITTFYYGNDVIYSTNNSITSYGSSGSGEFYSFSINDGGNDVCIFHR